MIQRILALGAGFLVAVMLGGWGQEGHPAGPEQGAAAQAIQALTTDEPDAVSRMPADFPVVMGYRPTREATRADGGCSSPFGGTGYHFSGACKQHDLGYDLLRYANRKGQPLGPWARRAVDDSFARHTLDRCHGLGCAATAGFYTAVVRFNSWRQGYGTPVHESVSAFAVPIAGGLLTAGLLGVLPLTRRARPGSAPARRLAQRLGRGSALQPGAQISAERGLA
jgi:hypothetical protein